MKPTTLGALLAVLLPPALSAEVTSQFDTTSEDWQVTSLLDLGPYDPPTQVLPASYEPAGGNPGGFISSTDPDSVTFWFDAPAKFLGNKSAYHGGTLGFDLFYQTDPANLPWEDADVLLVGAGMSLVMDAGDRPVYDTWTPYLVSLHEDAGWRVGDLNGAPPTDAEFAQVLSSLTALRIRGEFVYGQEFSGLDNVTLSGAPVPEAGTLAGGAVIALFAAIRIMRRRA